MNIEKIVFSKASKIIFNFFILSAIIMNILSEDYIWALGFSLALIANLSADNKHSKQKEDAVSLDGEQK